AMQRSARLRTAVQAGSDAIASAAAIAFATLARYDFHPHRVNLWGLFLAVPLAAVSQLTAGIAMGLYLGRWRRGSFVEVRALVQACLFATAMMFTFNLISGRMVPASAVIAGGIIAIVLMCGQRYVVRLLAERRRRPQDEEATRMLVFGAGEGGNQ